MNSLDQAERLTDIALQAVREMRDELQDGELDRAIAAMDEPENRRRKIVPKEEFNTDLPVYETKEDYER